MAVTELHRNVLRKAAKWRGSSKPAGGEVSPALLLEDAAVELVVPEDLELLALRVVVGAREPDDGRRAVSRGHVLDQPAAGAHLDELARFGGALGKELSNPHVVAFRSRAQRCSRQTQRSTGTGCRLFVTPSPHSP